MESIVGSAALDAIAQQDAVEKQAIDAKATSALNTANEVAGQFITVKAAAEAATATATNAYTSAQTANAAASNAQTQTLANRQAIVTEANTRGQADSAIQTQIANIVNGTTVVGKASNDANGNDIPTTYATKAELAPVATSGDYDDLTNKPTAGTNIEISVSNVISAPNVAAKAEAVGSFTLSLDPQTYELSIQAKDVNGTNIGTAQTVDLPIETMVVSGSYDDATQSITLTLQNGQTITFSVAGLVAGLQTQLTFDSTPVQNSTNPVTSGGVYTALAGKQNTLTFDAAPTQNSTNPVTSGGVYNALQNVTPSSVDLSTATGTLPASHGGTGKTTLAEAGSAIINALSVGESTPSDNDYYVCQYAGGGTTNTNYYRRPVKALWEYIKGKISSVLGLTASSYGGNAATATSATSATSATNASYASKIGTSSSHPAIGSTYIPVYVNSNGVVTACGGDLPDAIDDSLVPISSGVVQNQYICKGLASLGGVCSTPKATAAKTVSIYGITTLYAGTKVTVMFTNGNSAAAPTLNVSSTGAKNIKVVKAGAKITPPVHTGKWRGASSATTEGWQSLTTLELMYDGTDWVITGNPVVEDYFSDSQSYTVYANGLIEQWGTKPSSQNNDTYTTLSIIMSNNTYITLCTINQNTENIVWVADRLQDRFLIKCTQPRNICWRVIGY